MILHYPGLPPLSDFGIGIPVSDQRAPRCIAYLRERFPDLSIAGRAESTAHIEREDLERVHSKSYVDRLYGPELEQALIETFELIDEEGNYNRYDPSRAKQPLDALFSVLMEKTRGSLDCLERALEEGFCFYFGGGFHHAHRNFGHGFCLINDSIIAIRKLQAQGRLMRVWIIDVDAHKGDGSAALTAGDPEITTLSIHMARGWPLDRERFLKDGSPHPASTPSDIDIPVEEGEEALYLTKLQEGLKLLDSYRKPDLAVVVSGSDPYEKDRLESSSKLNLNLSQMGKRDALIYHFLEERKIPAAYLMAGGYSPESWEVYAQFLEAVYSATNVPR